MKMKRTAITPSKSTLMAMFGSDEPIGFSARREYLNKIRKAESVSALVEAIYSYAHDLREDQVEYDYISPYGGFDITVETVDEICLRELDALSAEIGENAYELALHTLIERLIKADEATHMTSFVEKYERFLKTPAEIKAEYAAWIEQKAAFYQKMEAVAKQQNIIGDKLYDRLTKEIDRIEAYQNRHPLRSFIFRKHYRETLDFLWQERDEAVNMAIESTESIIRSNEVYAAEETSILNDMPCFWRERFDDDPIYVYDDDALENAIEVAKSYTYDAENIALYERYCRLLSRPSMLSGNSN